MAFQINLLRSLQGAPRWLFLCFFGFLYWCFILSSAMFHKQRFSKPDEQDALRFALSRDRFWNLSKQPLPGFEHDFFKSRSGLKLHYITNQTNQQNTTDAVRHTSTLFILIHGFPDSSMSWRHLLRESMTPIKKARIVAVDLPNYGGSDSLEPPDTMVLEILTEFVIAMKEEHRKLVANSNECFNTVIVGHDWGCVVGYRLAAEAPGLADRFILSNGIHMGLIQANVDRVIASSSRMFRLFRENPWKNFCMLKRSLSALEPLPTQAFAFRYVFAFYLPRFMVELLGCGANAYFLRICGKLAHGRCKDEYDDQEFLASTFGPGVIEVASSTSGNQTYGESVKLRATSFGHAFWHQTSYYRGGLLSSLWHKSLETSAGLYSRESEKSTSSSSLPIIRWPSTLTCSTSFSERYQGVLRAPTTIIWGEKDSAVKKPICFDGISDYLAPGSEVIVLPRTGHWTPVERESRSILAVAMDTYATTESSVLAYVMKDLDPIYQGAVSLVRK